MNIQTQDAEAVGSSTELARQPEQDPRWLLAVKVARNRMPGGWVPIDADLVIALSARIADAPVAVMDTREALGLCAPTEDDFPRLYALKGRHVALVDLGAKPPDDRRLHPVD